MRALRFATLVLGFIALQLSLVGSVACGIASRGSGTGARAEAGPLMAGMMMSAAVEKHPSAAPHSPAPAPRPCDQPGAPGSCPPSASCAPALVGTVAERTPDRVLVIGVPALTVLAPSSLALPPELPPPRA